MLGGSVLTFNEEQPARLTLATSWHAKMTLALNDQIENVHGSNLHSYSDNTPKTNHTWKVFPTKSVELKDNCYCNNVP